jgi:hypothetical protein
LWKLARLTSLPLVRDDFARAVDQAIDKSKLRAPVDVEDSPMAKSARRLLDTETSLEDKHTILSEFEWLAGDESKAGNGIVRFYLEGGLAATIHCLDSTEPTIRAGSAFAIGTFAKHQGASVENARLLLVEGGVVQKLLTLLDTASESDQDVQKKALYALG